MVEIAIEDERGCTLEARIGRVHNRYRLIGFREPDSAIVGRLDGLCRERLPLQLDHELDRALGDNPTVYVIRSIKTRLSLDVDGEMTDQRLVKEWAAAIAREVAAAVAGLSRSPADVVRFDDQATFVARFLYDVVTAEAWGRWYYGAFERYRGCASPADVVRTVLVDQGGGLPLVLARLQRLGLLTRVLQTLEPVPLRQVWLAVLGQDCNRGPGADRPLVAMAIRLAMRLGVWEGTPADIDEIEMAYSANSPAAADWSDCRALTRAFLDIINFLGDKGLVRSAAPFAEAFREGHHGELVEFDWLDAELIRETLAHAGSKERNSTWSQQVLDSRPNPPSGGAARFASRPDQVRRGPG